MLDSLYPCTLDVKVCACVLLILYVTIEEPPTHSIKAFFRKKQTEAESITCVPLFSVSQNITAVGQHGMGLWGADLFLPKKNLYLPRKLPNFVP